MKTRIVIVGAGFAGLKAARTLARNSQLEITLIDQRNHHLFQPLLYQVATAGLSPAEIATPIRSVFSGCSNVRVVLSQIDGISLAEKMVSAKTEKYSYDFLILACGAEHSYFQHPEWEEVAPGLKTLEQATEIRRRILLAFETAEKEPNLEVQQEWLTFVIVGAGPTGVEMAGAIAEIARFTLEKDFRSIHSDRTRVILVEAGSRVLAGFSEDLSERAAQDLKKLNVEVRSSTRVTNVNASGVQLGDESVRARTVIWAAGVKPSRLSSLLKTELDSVGRVVVQPDLSLIKHSEVFVLGDQAHFPTADGRGLPGLAPVALQQGQHAAENILRTLLGLPRYPFKYRDKGTMATIGRSKAVVQIGRIEIAGLIAWWMWLFIHIFYLIGFKNRIFVFMEWFWSYVTFRRGARLIIDKEWRSQPKTHPSS